MPPNFTNIYHVGRVVVFCNAAIFSLSLCASFLCEGMNFLFLKRGKYFGFPPLLKWSLLIIFLIWILTFQASAKSGTHSSIGRKGHSFLEPGSLKIFSSRETNTTWRLKTEIRKKIREILQEENSYFIHTPKNDQTIASQFQEVLLKLFRATTVIQFLIFFFCAETQNFFHHQKTSLE